MAGAGKIPTDGGGGFGQNPFAALSGAGLPVAPKEVLEKAAAQLGGKNRPANAPEKNRGRVEIRRETGGRGGKTVTTASGFVGIGLPEKEQLAKKMRAACGCGGTVKDGTIEIRGGVSAGVGRRVIAGGSNRRRIKFRLQNGRLLRYSSVILGSE